MEKGLFVFVNYVIQSLIHIVSAPLYVVLLQSEIQKLFLIISLFSLVFSTC